MFSSTGVLRCYSRWILIDVDEEIGKYYRELYRLRRYKTERLNPPTTCHITVTSIHDLKKIGAENWWGYPNNEQIIEFEYSPEASDSGVYVVLPVVCARAQEIRDELGLGKPFYPFHITIGNRKENTCTQKNQTKMMT